MVDLNYVKAGVDLAACFLCRLLILDCLTKKAQAGTSGHKLACHDAVKTRPLP
jgi:hypothetical protein